MRRHVNVYVHPSLFEKMEFIRKKYENKGIRLTQLQQTSLIAQNVDLSKFRKINILGGRNVKKTKR